MSFEKELDVFLRSRVTLIVLATSEEERALQVIKSVCEKCLRPVLTWDAADHFQILCGEFASVPSAKEASAALEQMDKVPEDALFILMDFHDSWTNATIRRKLRTIAQRLKFTKKSILVTVPSTKIPDELKDEAVIVEFPPPTVGELESVLSRLTKAPGVRVNLTKAGREKLLQAALGLSAAQAQRVFAKAIVEDGVLDDRDIALVNEEKKQIIRESKALEYYSVTQTPDDVGGLEVLKEWLRLRHRGFTQEARAYGLPFPKGIVLIGIPGTGKSLTAKMIAGLWRLPLLRLDVGALYGSLMGESEERTRRALQLAETVAPCIIWLDEMEKALAHGDLDSGTSTRVFGAILTWMQEKTAPCFVVATANDISTLPHELLRKGRFDEIFFLDLPTREERRAIFAVHLAKRKRLPGDYDLDRLADESAGYVGAEIEQAIIDAMFVGFNDNREFTTEDASSALKRQIPLAVSQRETVGALRQWLHEGRAQSASNPEPNQDSKKTDPRRGP
jgi:ATP-dependent 26S proteasome regulatory subunit